MNMALHFNLDLRQDKKRKLATKVLCFIRLLEHSGVPKETDVRFHDNAAAPGCWNFFDQHWL